MKVLGSGACALVAMLVLGTPAAGAGGGPLIPSGSFGTEVTGPSGAPSAQSNYAVLGLPRDPVVVKIATDGGEIQQWRPLSGYWALPAVTQLGHAAGLSADGRTLVLIRPEYGARATETQFLVVDGESLKVRDRITLDGRYSFDAISPNGRLAYLVEYEDPRDPLEYRVRAYDLIEEDFRPGEIIDPAEPDEQMAGIPLARGYSPDGRWAYTLYSGGEETFIHALDTAGETAKCIDLTQFDPGGNIYRLGLEVDPGDGAITVLERGEPAASVDPQSFEVGPAESPPEEQSAGSEPATDDDSGVLVWIALGGGAGLLLLVTATSLQRRRTRRIYHDELERLVATEDDARREQVREREPVG